MKKYFWEHQCNLWHICGCWVLCRFVAVTNWPEIVECGPPILILFCLNIFLDLPFDHCLFEEEIMICLAPIWKVPMSLFTLYSVLLIIQWNLWSKRNEPSQRFAGVGSPVNIVPGIVIFVRPVPLTFSTLGSHLVLLFVTIVTFLLNIVTIVTQWLFLASGASPGATQHLGNPITTDNIRS